MDELFTGDGGDLHLSPLSEDDLDLARVARNEPRIRTRTREYRPLTSHDQARWFERVSALDTRDVMFAVRVHVDDDERSGVTVGVVGLCHWDPRDRTAETSFYLFEPQYERRGWMTRALTLLHRWGFDELGLDRIWAEAYDFNAPAIALLEKLGFQREGVLRQHVWRMGRRHDSVMLGLLRDDATDTIAR